MVSDLVPPLLFKRFCWLKTAFKQYFSGDEERPALTFQSQHLATDTPLFTDIIQNITGSHYCKAVSQAIFQILPKLDYFKFHFAMVQPVTATEIPVYIHEALWCLFFLASEAELRTSSILRLDHSHTTLRMYKVTLFTTTVYFEPWHTREAADYCLQWIKCSDVNLQCVQVLQTNVACLLSSSQSTRGAAGLSALDLGYSHRWRRVEKAGWTEN